MACVNTLSLVGGTERFSRVAVWHCGSTRTCAAIPQKTNSIASQRIDLIGWSNHGCGHGNAGVPDRGSRAKSLMERGRQN